MLYTRLQPTPVNDLVYDGTNKVAPNAVNDVVRAQSNKCFNLFEKRNAKPIMNHDVVNDSNDAVHAVVHVNGIGNCFANDAVDDVFEDLKMVLNTLFTRS